VLEHISQDLKEHAVVIDTGPLKQPVLKWAEELLPVDRYYIGFTPVINYDYLKEFDFGQDTAQPDLFDNCLMGVVSGKQANDEVMNLALNLVQMLGASPYFCDAAEIDGLMTMTHILPQLMAASLLKTSQETPGWREARKIAGKTYTQVTNPLIQDDSPATLAASLIYNQENNTRVLNDLIRTLVEIRDLSTTAGQSELEELFSKLQSDRDIWLLNRKESRWIETKKMDIPKSGFMSHLLGIRKPKLPKDKKE
jgi:prephenate dehydrogenase